MSSAVKLEGPVTTLHQPSAKDFELLREADVALEKQVSNLSFIRLSLLIIIIFLFARGLQRRNEESIQKTLTDIYSLAPQSGRNTPKLDPLSTYLFTPAWGTTDAEIEKRFATLKNQYAQVFKVEFSVLGTNISFDLRLIIVSFPLWLSLAQTYLSILREKRRLIRLVGYAFTTRAGSDQITAIDKLLFGSQEGPYRSYPGVLIDASFWVGLVVLLVMMVWITDVRTSEEEVLFIKLGLETVLISAFYASAFCSLISTRLRKQVEARLGCVVPLDTFGRVWHSSNRWLISLPMRVKPRLTLISAVILTLSTLLLQTAQVGCEHTGPRRTPRQSVPSQSNPSAKTTNATPQPGNARGDKRPGYELLTRTADWPLSLDPIFATINDAENLYGRTLYGFLLLTALVSLGLVWFIKPGSTRGSFLSRMILILSRIYAVISIAFICEFTNQTLLVWEWTWLIPLGITAVLFLLAWIANRRSPERADAIYRALRMGYMPLVLADVVYLGSTARTLPGLVVLFLSVHLMTLAYFSALSLHPHRENIANKAKAG